MPDFGLTEALAAAMKAAKEGAVMRPAEQKLAASAAKVAPASAAPEVPGAAPRAPQPAAAPPAEAPPGATQAPPVNPSEPPPAIPPQAAADAEAARPATPAAPQTAQAAADAAPAPTAPPVAEAAPVVPASAAEPGAVATGNRLPPEAPPPEAAASQAVHDEAVRFVTANLGDFKGRLDLSHMPNVDVMQTPDQFKAAILQFADENKDAINAARRGTVADEQLMAMAQDLAINGDVLKQVMTREFGMAVQRPEVLGAARLTELYHFGRLYALAARVADGSASSAEIAQYAQQRQLLELYHAQLAGAKAEWARSGRALQLPMGMPSEVADHVADVIRSQFPDMQAEAKAIRLAGTPQGVATITQGSLWYRSLVKAPFNLLSRIYINGILSGPATWAKILLGNNLNLALNQFDLFAAAAGRSAVNTAARLGRWPTAEEGATWDDAIAHLHGVISGGADALRVAGRVLRTGQSMDGILRSQEDFGRKTLTGMLPELNNSYFGGIARLVDTIIDAPGSRVIGGIDDFTKTLGYRGYLTMMSMKELKSRLVAGTLRPGDAESVIRDLMQNPSEEMQQAAEAWAHRMTFQSPWPEGGVGEAFQTVLNRAPVLRFIFPFMRTATNIFKQSLVERTPLALFSQRIRNQIQAGGMERDLAVARIATGTAIGSMFAWMAIHDRITGDAPKDPKARLAWEADGRTPYSIRMTDPVTGKESWKSYFWFEPIATIAGVISDAVQLHSYIFHTNDVYSMMPQEQRLQDAISHIMASVIQNTGNKTFMQGAAQFSEMYNDPVRAFSMWGDTMGAAMVPYSGMLKFMRNESDPYLRQAFTLMDKIRDELPLLSKHLMPRLDLFGEPRKNTSGNSVLGPLNPLPDSPIHRDEVTEEMRRIMDQTRTVPITMPSQQLAMLTNGKGLQDGMGMRLTPDEYYEYVRHSRAEPIFNGGTMTFKDRLSQLIASPLYQESSPPERAVLLGRIQSEADRAGRVKLWQENGEFRERLQAWTAEVNRQKFNK